MRRFLKPIEKTSRIEFEPNDIIVDPGSRKDIEDYDAEIRDKVRREYLNPAPCQPSNYNFPRPRINGQFRSFQPAWYQLFDWLEYSVQKDAVFCFYCYLFKPPRSRTHNRTKAFTNGGCNKWRKDIEKFNEHVGDFNSSYNNARRDGDAFRNQRQSLPHVLSNHSREMGIAYRARVTAVLNVIRFLLLQGLAFRGHHESSTSTNREKFFELVKWYADTNEAVSSVLNENTPANNRMTSPKIQKEFVRACAVETRRIIIDEIKERKFSILVDESCDKSTTQQMVVVVRFVNKGGHVIERFIGVLHITDISALSLKAALDELSAGYGLSFSQLRGQRYDGASNMRGQFNGLKTLILNENPFAFYVHCFAHQLQLVVVSVVKSIPAVADFFNYVSMIVNIVGASSRRRDMLIQNHHDKVMQVV